MAINFEVFGLPADGQTRLSGIDSYEARSMETQGFTLVGICEVDDENGKDKKTYGLYRMNESEALASALKGKQTAESESNTAAVKRNDMEKERDNAMSALVEATTKAAAAEGLRKDLAAIRRYLGDGGFDGAFSSGMALLAADKEVDCPL